MLKKINRLSQVRLKDSKNISTPLFSLKSAKNNLDFPRFGFVISKKVDKSAVGRNSLKRKLSSCIEEIFDRIKGDGRDFVFYPNATAAQASREKLLEEIEKVILIKEK